MGATALAPGPQPIRIEIDSRPLPESSLFHASLPRFDYIDIYGCEFESRADLKVADAFRAFFLSAPGWVHFLMRLRDRIVSVVGLKTSGKLDETALDRFELAPGNSLGVFRIFAVAENEVITGEDDRHLDFRVSARLERLPGRTRYRLTVATGVRLKNLMGRLYFAPVKIFHRLIVKAMLPTMARRLAAMNP